MIKKLCYLAFIIMFALFSWSHQSCMAADYGKRLSLKERNQLCEEIKAAHEQTANLEKPSSLGGGIIPDSVLSNIYNTTRNISDATAFLLVLGHALTCNAVHANNWTVSVLGVTLMSIPNIPVWLCGAIIYFFGFMLTLSVTFYLVDIAFKLGFAVIMLPIGIALWPFPVTKDKLTILISIMLKNAAIFVFLAMAVSYALNLINTATGGMEELFTRIDNNETDTVSRDFNIISMNFLVILFALIYGMKLIGSAVADYADKFFPDKAFGGGQKASPIHGSMTQGMDFVKKKAVAPVAMWAGDKAKVQIGKATAGVGKLMTGQYNRQLKKAAYYAAHPTVAAEQGSRKAAKFAAKIGSSTAQAANNVLVGGLGRVVLGKNASQNLKEQLSQKIDARQERVNDWADKHDEQINQNIENSRITKVAHGAEKQLSKIDRAYQKTINGLDRASDYLDDLSKPLDNKINSLCADIDENADKSTFLGKAAANVKKAGIRTAGAMVQIPVKTATAVANIPVKVAKTAVKAAYVKNWVKTSGNILQSVGEKMQQNTRPEARRQRLKAQQAQQDEAKRQQEEEERQREYNRQINAE